MVTKHTILTARWPEEIFPEADHRTAFIALAKEWHPDHNKDNQAGEVFGKINSFYETLKARLRAGGTWGGGHVVDSPHGPICYLEKTKTEDGVVYVGQKEVVYVLDDDYAPFEPFRFATTRMSEEFRKIVPSVYKWRDRRTFHVSKEPEYLHLRHVLTHCGGVIPVDHVAWMVSRLCNFCCWLEWLGRTHNAIHVDNLFVNPVTHSVFVAGGWWHSAELGKPLKTLPQSSFRLLAQRQKPVASQILDGECLRQVARELLGTQTCPKEMSDWLVSVPHKSAVQDFLSWQAAKEKSFPRRFVKWSINDRDIYGGFDGRR